MVPIAKILHSTVRTHAHHDQEQVVGAHHLGKMSEPAARTTVPCPSWNTCSSKSMPEGVRCTLRPITFSILQHMSCQGYIALTHDNKQRW